MFLAPRQRKTAVFTRFWASASKKHGIYSVLWPGPSKNTGIYAVSSMLSEAFFGCQRHKNGVNYTIFTRGRHQKNMQNPPKFDQKTPNKDLQNASSNLTLFFLTPNPPKTLKPQHPEGFSKRSAAPECARVAEAILSNHHHTARHRQNGPTPWCRGSGALARSICCETLQPLWTPAACHLPLWSSVVRAFKPAVCQPWNA